MPPRTAAAGVSASWMHRVASQAHLACMSSPVARRSMSGSRITPFMFLQDTNHGLFQSVWFAVGAQEWSYHQRSAARTAAPPSHCFPVRYGAAMERHERQIAPEPVSAHLPPFTVGLTKGAVRHSPRCPSGVLRRTRRKPGTVVAGLPPVHPPGFIKQAGEPPADAGR